VLAIRPQAEVVLSAEQLQIGYSSEDPVAGPVDVAIRSSEFVCLLGPNGCGKTTLLRTLSGLLPSLAGQVCLTGEDLDSLSGRERARRLSLVLTGRPSLGGLSVRAVVALGRYPHTGWLGRETTSERSIIERALSDLKLESFAERSVGELSDGEVQRVLVARALAQEPRVLILDEATAFLDLERRSELMETLLDACRSRELGVLLSTHDLELALARADRIWLLGSDRRLVEGAPEDLARSGALEVLFGDGGVKFDAELGRFKRVNSGNSLARLEGDGSSALWCRRTLERCGFVVTEQETDSAEWTVRCLVSGGFEVGAGDRPAEYVQVGTLAEVARIVSVLA